MTKYVVPSFIFSVDNQNSTVVAKNFVATWNPVGSGRIMSPSSLYVSYTATVVSPLSSLRGYRISTQPTGGTLHPPEALCKLDTAQPDSSALIYTNNPSVGPLGAPFFSMPPGIDKRTSDVQILSLADMGGLFLVRPGEGIVIRQSSGSPGHYWSIAFAWGSRDL